MKTETPAYAALRQRAAHQPIYIAQPYHVVRSGASAEWPFTRGFSTGPVTAGTRPYLELLGRPGGNTQTVVPEEGQSSIGVMTLPVLDQAGEVLRYLSNPRVALANAITGTVASRPSFLEGQTSIGGYPAVGTLALGTERVRYGQRNDATNRFTDLQWAVDGTSPVGHAVGEIMQNGEQLRAGQRIQLLAGYRDLDERLFLRFAKMEITSSALGNDGLTWILSLADVQKAIQRLIFPANQGNIIEIEGNPLTIALRMLLSTGSAAVSSGTIQMLPPNIIVGTGTNFLEFFRAGEIFVGAPFTGAEKVLTVASVESNERLYVAGNTSGSLQPTGANRLTNGGFPTSLNWWTVEVTGSGVVAQASGRARLGFTPGAGSGTAALRQMGSVVAPNLDHLLEFDIIGGDLTALEVGSTSGGTDLFQGPIPAGHRSMIVRSPASAVSVRFKLSGSYPQETFIDNVSLRRINLIETGPITEASATGLAYRRAGRAGKYDVFNGTWSLALPAAFVDVAGVEALRDSKFPDTSFRFRINAPEDAKTFLETELLKPLNAYPLVTQDGAYSCRVYEGRDGTPVATLDEDQIIGWTWQGGEDRIINQAEIQYDFNDALAPAMFGFKQRYTANGSVEKYGLRPPFKMAAKGLRDDLNVQDEVDRWAFELFQRYSDSAPRLQLVVRYGHHVLDVGETVAVTHSRIPNRLTGVRGLVNEPFQIRDTRPAWGAEGKVVMTLIQVSVLDTIDQPIGDPFELARTDLVVARSSFFNAASVSLPNNVETETGSVTVTLTSIADSLHISARQYVTSAQVATAPTDVFSRIRLGSAGGTLIDGIMPEAFLAATATAKSTDQYARRGIVKHDRLYAPGLTGNLTIVMTGLCLAAGGAIRDRSMTVTVRRP